MAREIFWNGKTEEEVKQMSTEDVLPLISSRARRSVKRGYTDAQKILIKKLEEDQKNIKTHCRDVVILPFMIGKTINVYNGKDFVAVNITMEMVGHFLGEFALTRKNVSHSAAGVGATRSSKAISAR